MQSTKTLTPKEFYAVYPALHELQASIESLLNSLSRDWQVDSWLQLQRERSAQFNEDIRQYTDEIEDALSDDRLETSVPDFLPGIADALGAVIDDPKWGRILLESDLEDLIIHVFEIGIEALGNSAVRFRIQVEGITRPNGRLPADAIGSILPAEMRDEDNQRPGGRPKLSDLVLDEKALTITWARRPASEFASADQFRFLQLLVSRKGQYVLNQDLLEGLAKHSVEVDSFKHLKRRVVKSLKAGGYSEVAGAIKPRPSEDGEHGYGFMP